MKAIILAAGRGSRMGKATQNSHKCRSILHGKELIQWQLDSLMEAGIKDIAIVTGYLSETFDFDLTYFHNSKWSETNMIRSLLKADDWLNKDTCIVSYADIAYFPQPIYDLMETKDDIAITYDPNWIDLWSRRFTDPLQDAETFRLQGSYLDEIGAKPASFDEIEGQFMGLIKFNPRGWSKVKSKLSKLPVEKLNRLDSTGLLQNLITDGLMIGAIKVNSPWAEVDGEKDLLLYNKDPFLSQQWKDALIKENL